MKTYDLNVGGYNLSVAAEEKDGLQWVAIKPICEAIGIKPHKQIERLNKDVRFSCTQLGSTGKDGKHYEMTFIPVDQVAGFLYTVNSRKSQNPEVSTKLLVFQKYLQKVMNSIVLGQVPLDEHKMLQAAYESVLVELKHQTERMNAMAIDISILADAVGVEVSNSARTLNTSKKLKKMTNVSYLTRVV